MIPLPNQLVDRWNGRSEPGPAEGKLYWHILFNDDPQVHAIANAAQQRLARFSGLHMTPPRWLHITVLVVGSTEAQASGDVGRMLDAARKELAEVPPITVRLGHVLYHREAIMLGVHPSRALDSVLAAVWSATRVVIGHDENVTGGEAGTWVPHLTVCYSTSSQPAAPIISALGTELPSCDVTVSAVTLVDQRGQERDWNWRPVGTAQLRGRATTHK